MITLPVNSSVYQTMVANIQQLQSNQDGTLCITPMQVQNNPQHNRQHRQHNANSTNTNTTNCSYNSSLFSSASNCKISTTTPAAAAAIASTPSAVLTSAAAGYPLYNPYTSTSVQRPQLHAHPLFGQLSMGLAAAAQQLKQLQQREAAGSISRKHSNTAPKSMTPKQSIVHRKNVASPVVASGAALEKYHRAMCNNNPNSNHNCATMIDRNNNEMVPKVEHADEDHSQAVIDADGNIIIRFGDGTPIKIECDCNDLKA